MSGSESVLRRTERVIQVAASTSGAFRAARPKAADTHGCSAAMPRSLPVPTGVYKETQALQGWPAARPPPFSRMVSYKLQRHGARHRDRLNRATRRECREIERSAMPNGIGDTQARASAHTPEGRASPASAGVGGADLCYQSRSHEVARGECRRRNCNLVCACVLGKAGHGASGEGERGGRGRVRAAEGARVRRGVLCGGACCAGVPGAAQPRVSTPKL